MRTTLDIDDDLLEPELLRWDRILSPRQITDTSCWHSPRPRAGGS